MNFVSAPNLAILAAVATLSFGTQAMAQDTGADESQVEQAKEDSDKLICRTEKVIGSLAKRRKTCLTRAQWEAVARRGNAFSRSLVEGARSGMRLDDPAG